MKRMKGQVVVLTGAGRGLGRALARLFHEQGACLALGARSTHEIDELAAELGQDAIALQTDVRSMVDCERLVDAAMAEFGQLDVMVNNAGVAIYGPLSGMGQAEVDLMVDTNVKGTMFGTLAAYRVMKERRSGLILNISSIAGKLHLPNEAIYGASKWAVNGFSGALRLEAMAHRVRVTTVCPGGINTPFWREQEFLPFPEHLDPAEDFLDPEALARLIVELSLAPPEMVVPEVTILPMLR